MHLTTNPVIIILGIAFGVMATALVVYGLVQSKRQPRSQAQSPTAPVPKPVPKPQRTEVKTKSSEPTDYFCQKCYAMISPDLEFCSECGAKQY